VAAALVCCGQFFLHYDRVLASQLGAILGQAGRIETGFLAYVPCLPKSSVVIGAFAFFLFLWAGAEKILAAEENA
jgi:hypothetical protein